MDAPLIDRFGRQIKSVRLSVTDRCNLRCKYCMPEEGVEWVNKTNLLSFEEILRVAKILYNTGVRNFRLTGGEPLLRQDIVKLCEFLISELQDIELSVTTNAVLLPKLAQKLKEVGVIRLNISLDTLDRNKFNEITQRKDFDRVMKGIETAVKLKFEKIKINAVSIKDFNTDEKSLKQFIDFSQQNNVEIRFIELMPFTGMGWEENKFIPSKDLIEKIKRTEEMKILPLEDKSQTSRVWSLRNGKANFGFISSVSESFCHSCDRIRLTAEGNIRPCLHASKEYPLRDKLRSGASNKEILEIIRHGLNEKWKEHPDFLSLNYLPPFDDREMIRIGG